MSMENWFGGSNKPAATQVSTGGSTAPWEPIQDDLLDNIAGAKGLLSSGKGWYRGDVTAPVDYRLQSAMDGIYNKSFSPVANLDQANSLVNGLLTNGGQGAYGAGLLQNNGLTSDLRGVADMMNPIASGQEADNPHLQAMIDASNAKIGAQQASIAGSRGRFGSGYHDVAATRAMAEAANPILAQAYESGKNRQLTAQGLLSGLYGSGLDRASSLYNSGMDRAAGSVGLLSGLDALKYAGEDRRATVGDYFQQRAQAEKDADIQQAEIPREQREWLNAMLSGAGKLGTEKDATNVVTFGKKKSPLEQIAGYASLLGGLL